MPSTQSQRSGSGVSYSAADQAEELVGVPVLPQEPPPMAIPGSTYVPPTQAPLAYEQPGGYATEPAGGNDTYYATSPEGQTYTAQGAPEGNAYSLTPYDSGQPPPSGQVGYQEQAPRFQPGALMGDAPYPGVEQGIPPIPFGDQRPPTRQGQNIGYGLYSNERTPQGSTFGGQLPPEAYGPPEVPRAGNWYDPIVDGIGFAVDAAVPAVGAQEATAPPIDMGHSKELGDGGRIWDQAQQLTQTEPGMYEDPYTGPGRYADVYGKEPPRKNTGGKGTLFVPEAGLDTFLPEIDQEAADRPLYVSGQPVGPLEPGTWETPDEMVNALLQHENPEVAASAAAVGDRGGAPTLDFLQKDNPEVEASAVLRDIPPLAGGPTPAALNLLGTNERFDQDVLDQFLIDPNQSVVPTSREFFQSPHTATPTGGTSAVRDTGGTPATPGEVTAPSEGRARLALVVGEDGTPSLVDSERTSDAWAAGQGVIDIRSPAIAPLIEQGFQPAFPLKTDGTGNYVTDAEGRYIPDTSAEPISEFQWVGNNSTGELATWDAFVSPQQLFSLQQQGYAAGLVLKDDADKLLANGLVSQEDYDGLLWADEAKTIPANRNIIAKPDWAAAMGWSTGAPSDVVYEDVPLTETYTGGDSGSDSNGYTRRSYSSGGGGGGGYSRRSYGGSGGGYGGGRGGGAGYPAGNGAFDLSGIPSDFGGGDFLAGMRANPMFANFFSNWDSAWPMDQGTSSQAMDMSSDTGPTSNRYRSRRRRKLRRGSRSGTTPSNPSGSNQAMAGNLDRVKELRDR